MMLWGQLFFQNANSSIMENMIMFHDYIMLIIMMILMMIIYMLFFIFKNKILNRYILNNQMIEIIWTIIPMMFLMFLAIPSLKILYLSDEINNSLISVKIIGHQWYWSYEYIDFYNINFDSFMINENNNYMFRLLDVDNRLILPVKNYIKFLINSSDVIHSFTIPSLGIKVDAIPGRMNQIMIFMNRSGLYFGQCSEICGINHSFMPIVVESIKLNSFLNWIKNF